VVAVVGEAAVAIRPETGGFNDNAEKNVLGSIGGIAKKATVLLGAAFAGAAVVSGLKSFYDAAAESAKIGALTTQVIKSTGGAAQLTADQVGNLVTKISNKTGVDDEAIQSGANLLLTFTNIKNAAGAGNDIFTQTTQIMTDMSAALGTDASGSAIQLGKALNDPVKGVSALTKVGVSFTQQQKDQIASMVAAGDTMGAQKVILGELNKEFGGAAEAASTPLDKLKVNLGNIQEAIGAQLLPVVAEFAGFATSTLLPALSTLGDIAGQAFNVLFHGDFTGGPLAEDSPIIDTLFNLRDGFIHFKDAVVAFVQGDTFAAWVQIAKDAAGLLWQGLQGLAGFVTGTLVPAFVWVVQAVGQVAEFFRTHQAAAIALGIAVGIVASLVVAAWAIQVAASIAGAATSIASWFAVAVGAQTAAEGSTRSTAQVVFGWVAAAAAAVWNAAIVVGGWVLMGAQSMIQAVRMAAAWVIALGPVAWVIAAVVAVAALVIANWDTIKKWTIDAWNAIVGALKAAWDWIVSAVTTAFNWVIDFVTGLPGRIVAGLAALGSMLWDALTAALAFAWEAIKIGFDLWVSYVLLFPVRVIQGLIILGVLLWQALSAAFNFAVTAITDFISAAVSFFTELPGKIWDALVSLGQTLWDLATAAWALFSQAVTTGVNAVIDFVVSIPSRIWNGLIILGQTLWDLAVAAWDLFSTAVRAGIDAAIDFVTGLPGRIWNGLIIIGQNLWDLATAAWALFSNAVRTGIDAAIDFIAGLPGRIWNGLKNMGGMLVSLGTDLMHGLVDGISSAAQFVGNVAKNVVNAIIGFINDKMIDGINNLLDFTVAGIHINVPDIPHIPKLHEGGVFQQDEGLALLRAGELVVTPEQRASAESLLSGLLRGGPTAPAGAAGPAPITIEEHVHQAPGEPPGAVAALVTQNVVWRLNGGITRTVGAAGGPL
jgi:hypothetical protein